MNFLTNQNIQSFFAKGKYNVFAISQSQWFQLLQVKALITSVTLAIAVTTISSTPAHAGWQITFNDEFSSGSLDRTKWKTKDYWGNQTLSGNNEKQCYLPDVFDVSDGILNIKAEPRLTPKSQCHGAKADMPYASGMITTSGCNQWERGAHCQGLQRFSQTYGYFEMRARLPKGQGLWPAFWLIPASGGWPPEIDVMEWLGRDPDTMYMTYHYPNNTGGYGGKFGGVFDGPDFSADYHRFGVDWKPGVLIYYVDGVERYRVTDAKVSSVPMYIIANLAVGGYWPGYPDASTPFPANMQIDYIRAYQRVDNGEPDTLPPTPDFGGGLRGEYFDNLDFTDLKTTRTDATVSFDWGDSTPPDTALTSPETFSVRWTGQIEAPVSGSYTFTTTSDDGVRLWVNEQLVIDNWTDHAPTDDTGTINLEAGQRYDIQLEFYENGGWAVAELSWEYPGQSRQIVPQDRLFPAPSNSNLIINQFEF